MRSAELALGGRPWSAPNLRTPSPARRQVRRAPVPERSAALVALESRRRLSRAFAAISFIGLLLLTLTALLAPTEAFAQSMPALTSTPAAGGGQTYSLSIQTLLLLTSLTFLPAVVLMMTAFTRMIIVLSLLRHALGTQTSPPNQVMVGLALFLTFFIMAPTAERIYAEAYLPLSESRIDFNQALERGAEPLRGFMLKQTREPDLSLFAGIAKAPKVDKPEQLPMRVIVPAFVTSELKTAFQIGFVVFIPFLIIDMVVASVLMSMGMMMMSPVIVSLPFKIMLFVLVDGWTLLVGSLVQSFG